MYRAIRRGYRGVLALLGAAALSVALAGAAGAWPEFVDGRPAGFHPGSASGYYVWHTGRATPHWHLETTDPPGTSHVYTGTLTTDGRFVGVTGVRPETADRIGQVGDGQLQFRFDTYAGIDGVSFSIDGGTSLTLALEVDGVPAPPTLINLGRASTHPPTNPLLLWR